MKTMQIRFFTPDDNTETKPQKAKAKPIKLEGYISPVGKLVFPIKIVDQLGIDADSVKFKIGTQQGKRKIKSLYLIPTDDSQGDTFELKKAAKSYTIALGLILQKGEIDYSLTNYSFTIAPFDFGSGLAGYELTLANSAPKPPYTGKPRGRKPKTEN